MTTITSRSVEDFEDTVAFLKSRTSISKSGGEK